MSQVATATTAGVQPIRLAPARADLIVEELRRAILRGELKPGAPLVERDLAAALGVSKTPVREAIKALVATGLLEVSPYRGASVRRVDPDLATNVYAVRMLLEPEAARLAARKPRSPDVDEAEGALRRADAAVKKRDFSQMALFNREFHQGLAQACGNPVLIKMLADLQDQKALVATQGWRKQQTWDQEAGEHWAILRAVRAGESEAAARLMHSHIERALAGLRAGFSEDGAAGDR